MTMLLVYLSALVLGFTIVAAIALAYAVMSYEDDKSDESSGPANANLVR